MKLKTKLIAGLALLSAAGLSGNALACPGITLPVATTSNTVSFGDALAYSLPILGLDVPSTPGQISDCIVIATGSSGQGVTTNFVGMNNAFATPSGNGAPSWFQMGATAAFADPGTLGGLSAVQNQPNTWDTTLTALKTFLTTANGVQAPVFYFNHNENNSGSAIDQNVAVWAQLKLWNSTTGVATYFYATATFGTPGLNNFGLAGNQTALYTGPQTAATCNYPATTDCIATLAGSSPFPTGAILGAASTQVTLTSAGYMINSQGQVCLNGPVGVGQPVPCDGSGGPVVATVNENLGADHAANAVLFPELNAILDGIFAGGANPLGFDTLSIDFRMGCNADVRIDGSNGGTAGVCPLGMDENNGFEQLFLGRTPTAPCVGPNCGQVFLPEPGTLALFGLGLLAVGVGGVIRRRKS